jgi:diadenosine tetraphosphate (Ap4A) HIT family hydrolase
MFNLLLTVLAICPFCNPEVIKRQSVAETERFHVLYCLTPATEGNLLLIPKRHLTRFEELNPLESVELLGLIQKTQAVFKRCYGLEDYILLQKNGKNAGQSVGHIHVHAVPCPDDMEFIRMFRYRPALTHEEMQTCVSKLKPFFK